jgi:hypothetical protein
MELQVQHNLNDEELCKAITGMAAASGIQDDVIEELQKAVGCDNRPKVPRTRATKELYHRMLAEFHAAQTDIERYHQEIATSAIAKASAARQPLTPEQLRRLQLAINDRYGFIAAQLQSEGYQPPADILERWKQLGLVSQTVTPETFALGIPAELHFIRNAFLMGKFIEAVESGKSFAEVMDLARYAPLLAPDIHAIAIAEQETANYPTNNASDLATQVGQAWAKQQSETVREMAVQFHARTLTRTVLDRESKQLQGIATPARPVETWQQFASELHRTMEDKARDWSRVAYYEITDAQKQGMAHALLADGNVDKPVYKVPLSTACAQCKHLYLLPDGKTPRVFKLSGLIRNGTNIGRKPHPIRGGKVAPGGRADGSDTMKAVAGLIHPWCACLGPYAYTGYEPWAKKT